MAGKLAGKVAIVTGVSHDGQVGQAVARALAAEGASLAIPDCKTRIAKPADLSLVEMVFIVESSGDLFLPQAGAPRKRQIVTITPQCNSCCATGPRSPLRRCDGALLFARPHRAASR